jgi:3-hydroxyacyl-[acyl-carrier-protein] dehydratase
MSQEKILASIPHRPPFLLLDEIVEQSDTQIVGLKRFTGEEYFFEGHYPEFPLVPGVLLCEAAMQCGAVLLSQLVGENNERGAPGGLSSSAGLVGDSALLDKPAVAPTSLDEPVAPTLGNSKKIPVATRMNDVRFKRIVRPGETIRIEIDLAERLADAFFLKAKVTVEGQVAVRFEFACTLTEKLTGK